ncbi:50S ribosomal protein L32 [Candidatus Gottesmanbacteria bacterium RIFCSPLOWO2_01_FULL_46_9]|uniref:Large ribosomal subunit protein bL32 n=1 Tax=Candidatus Gottesmanbacteria bacterium RIFCSPLOWO2_01_FULL_46_9 TaxID=1798394 RepID=A0A1F6B0Y6_9BACT|nr:MAG: 50S ribosomal protein L32 [Candidatus Gottesmanbacteria bacterium RIFCSPLOWO2_01_FULL_46_9]
MTPLPKRRHSTRRGGKRKAAIKLSLAGLLVCAHCGKKRFPHRVCPSCGYYEGREVVKPKVKKAKKTKN